MSLTSRFRVHLLQNIPRILSDIRRDHARSLTELRHLSTSCSSRGSCTITSLRISYSVEVQDSTYVPLDEAWVQTVVVTIRLPSNLNIPDGSEERVFENKVFLFEHRLRKMLETYIPDAR